MLIEVLKPFETCIVVGPAILGRFNDLVAWNVAARVLGGEVESARDAEERRHYMTIRRNATNRRCPFSIARLDGLWFANPIRACNYHPRPNYAHYKARLVKVVEVTVLDGVLCAYVSD